MENDKKNENTLFKIIKNVFDFNYQTSILDTTCKIIATDLFALIIFFFLYKIPLSFSKNSLLSFMLTEVFLFFGIFACTFLINSSRLKKLLLQTVAEDIPARIMFFQNMNSLFQWIGWLITSGVLILLNDAFTLFETDISEKYLINLIISLVLGTLHGTYLAIQNSFIAPAWKMLLK